MLVEQLRDGAVQHAVTEELQTLVVRRTEAAVGQRLLQVTRVTKAITQRPFDGFQLGRGYSRRVEVDVQTDIAKQRFFHTVFGGDHQFAAVA
jgi:hypothetical protein